MKLIHLLTMFLTAIVMLGQVAPFARAQDPEDTAVMTELRRRDENVGKLSVEEQLKVRAAQQKALEDAEVKSAMEKRDQAVVEFRGKLRAAMISADPSVKPILDKIAEGSDPGLAFGR